MDHLPSGDPHARKKGNDSTDKSLFIMQEPFIHQSSQNIKAQTIHQKDNTKFQQGHGVDRVTSNFWLVQYCRNSRIELNCHRPFLHQ